MSTVNPNQQTRQHTPESGLRYDRFYFVREERAGETPSDPNYMRYSDVIMETDGDPTPGNEPIETVGSPDPGGFGNALEENNMTVTYGLQRPIVTPDGEMHDACADALLRTEAKEMPNTHTMYARHNNPSPGPNDPDGVWGQRQYTIMVGAKADVTLEPDATDEEPIPVELEYMGERLRTYHIWQPENSTSLVVTSDSENDDADVTIESEGGAQSETVTLNGTTDVETSVSFDDVDAFYLSDECEGNVTLHISDGGSAGTTLSTLYGGQYYSNDMGSLEGDRGVPPIGDGSFEDELGTPLEDIQDDIFEFEFPDPNAPTPEMFNISIEVDNNLETYARGGTTRPGIAEGNRNVEIGVNVVGERANHDMLHQAYSKRPVTLAWELALTRLEFPEAICTEPPGLAAESDQSYVETEGTYIPGGGVIVEATDIASQFING